MIDLYFFPKFLLKTKKQPYRTAPLYFFAWKATVNNQKYDALALAKEWRDSMSKLELKLITNTVFHQDV